MYRYRVSAGYPEGTNFSYDICHEDIYTQDEFNEIVEKAFLEVCKVKEQSRKEKECVSYAYDCSMADELLMEALLKVGFTRDESCTASYYLEPYWGKSCVKNEELRQYLAAEDPEEEEPENGE